MADNTAVALQGPAARLTPALRSSAIDAVGKGVRRSAALVLAGIPERTARMWLEVADGRKQTWPDGSPIEKPALMFLTALAADFGRAEAARELRIIGNIADAADSVNEKTGIREWRAGAWLMEHAPAYKREYSEYRETRIEHAGQVNHEHRIASQLSDAELIEALPTEWRELVNADGNADEATSEHEPQV